MIVIVCAEVIDRKGNREMKDRKNLLKKLHKQGARWAVAGAGCVILCLAGLYFILQPKEEIQTSAGIKKLKNLEKYEIASIEKEIREIEKEWRRTDEEYLNRSPNEKINDALILGDSRTKGLEAYQILDSSKVIAEIGISLAQTGGAIEQTIKAAPQYIFLAYGLNDFEYWRGDAEAFKEEYRKVIRKLKEGLPESEIYVNTLLPVQQNAVAKNGYYNQMGNYNEAIRELCEEEEVGCVDVSDLARDELYEGDGIHLRKDYYPLWVDKMAEVAGI